MRSVVAKSSAALLTAGLLLTSASTLSGQEIQGRVVAADEGGPIPTALVELFDRNGEKVGAAVSDADGRFRVGAPDSGGPFALDVWALGYRRAAIDSLVLPGSDDLVLGDIVLEASPIELDTLEVETSRGRGLLPGRELIRRRQLLGKGTFLSGAMIAAEDPPSLAYHVSEAAGLMMRYPSVFSSDAWGRCMHIHINHWPMAQSGYRNLDEIPLDQIAAVEIYNTPDDIPRERLINLDAAFSGCGLLNIWLWNSW